MLFKIILYSVFLPYHIATGRLYREGFKMRRIARETFISELQNQLLPSLQNTDSKYTRDLYISVSYLMEELKK